MQLTTQIGVPVPASAILFEAVQFALMVAEETGGAFDRHRWASSSRCRASDDRARKTITLLRPLPLDLGAVAKGLAVDAAARELQPFTDFAIDAGGDLYLGGLQPARRARGPSASGIRATTAS